MGSGAAAGSSPLNAGSPTVPAVPIPGKKSERAGDKQKKYTYNSFLSLINFNPKIGNFFKVIRLWFFEYPFIVISIVIVKFSPLITNLNLANFV